MSEPVIEVVIVCDGVRYLAKPLTVTIDKENSRAMIAVKGRLPISMKVERLKSEAGGEGGAWRGSGAGMGRAGRCPEP